MELVIFLGTVFIVIFLMVLAYMVINDYMNEKRP